MPTLDERRARRRAWESQYYRQPKWRERRAAYSAKYRQTPKGKATVRARRRAFRLRVFERDGFVCCYCRKQFAYNELEVDHKLPKGLGGTNHQYNLVTACRTCNQKKGCSTYEEFMLLMDQEREWADDWPFNEGG